MEKKILEILKSLELIDIEIDRHDTFDNMGLDSVDQLKFFMMVEEEFEIEISDGDISEISSLDDLVSFISKRK